MMTKRDRIGGLHLTGAARDLTLCGLASKWAHHPRTRSFLDGQIIFFNSMFYGSVNLSAYGETL